MEELVNSSSQRFEKPRLAFATMVSNHKYLDGALVLAASIRDHSDFVANGTADIVLITNPKINRKMFPLLLVVYSRIVLVNTLASLAAKSYYKTTFDKLYLFFLSSYDAIIFMDADSLVIGNPDRLFRKVSSKHPVVAVGGSDYFQTGLLIVKPSRELFAELYNEFRFGSFGYDQWRARDGILLRNCFLEHHGNIAHPTDCIYHFYGFVKPWFNKDAVYRLAKGERQTFGPEYRAWWVLYEKVHKQFPFRENDELYGGSAVTNKFQRYLTPSQIRSGADSRDFMWMQRYSVGNEYLRPTFQKMASLRNQSLTPGSKVILHEGLDCNSSCKMEGLHCSESELALSTVNDCIYSGQHSLGGQKCSGCVASFENSAAPYISKSGECHYNFLHDSKFLPSCGAPVDGKKTRLCVCLG